jgi:hypothetical protein
MSAEKQESRKAESRKQEAKGRKAGSCRKMALQTALWFLFAFCVLLFISQVYHEQSIFAFCFLSRKFITGKAYKTGFYSEKYCVKI